MERRSKRWLAAAGSAVVLAVLAFALVAVVGRADGSAPAPGSASADAGFSRDMAVHHQQAVELSFIVRDRAHDENVRLLAYDVINTQANQRGMMLGWLDMWNLPKSSSQAPMAWMGHGMSYTAHDGSLMPGMATNSQLDQLRKADGKAAEILYLKLMTAHHKGGIEMAQMAVDLAGTNEVRSLAEGMVRGQKSEIALMADMLKERGASTDG